jgi:hypothetical protein
MSAIGNEITFQKNVKIQMPSASEPALDRMAADHAAFFSVVRRGCGRSCRGRPSHAAEAEGERRHERHHRPGDLRVDQALRRSSGFTNTVIGFFSFTAAVSARRPRRPRPSFCSQPTPILSPV